MSSPSVRNDRESNAPREAQPDTKKVDCVENNVAENEQSKCRRRQIFHLTCG